MSVSLMAKSLWESFLWTVLGFTLAYDTAQMSHGDVYVPILPYVTLKSIE